MTLITKTPVKINQYIFGVTKDEVVEQKIAMAMESGGTKTTELASLVLTLIKFELMRRDAYKRWRSYLNQVGLRLYDLIAYLNVLHDDEQIIKSLKAYYFKSKNAEYDRTTLLEEADQLIEQLMEKVDQGKILGDFTVQSVRTSEQLQYK